MSKRTALSAALAVSRVEKDVENAYRAEVSAQRPDASWSSPHATDGLAVWSASNPPMSVRLLLEAKYDLDFKSRGPVCSVLGQLILYLKKFEASGAAMPNVLLVGDRNECFVLATDAVRGFLNLSLDWNVAPSAGSPELTRALVSGFNLLPYVYDVNGDLDFGEVLTKIETLAAGNTHHVRATRTNLSAIFVYWRDNVFKNPEKGKGALTPTEQVDVFLRCLFHPDEVHPHPTKRGVLVVPGYDDAVLVNADQYRSFFAHFEQGYKPSEVEAFYADKDRLVEDDARRRQGAFFTPAIWAAEANKELERVLGANWRSECVVWDCAAGTGNLTRDYNDWGCLISSTAERPDVNVMREQGWGGQHVFQYDFLNDNAQSPFFALEDGDNRVPTRVEKVLRAAAKAGKRLVFYMNPPYGTANNAGTEVGDHKAGIALTEVNKQMKAAKLGPCSQQLYAQFMYRASVLAKELGFESVTIALFSVPTFMSGCSYQAFRAWWYAAGAFVSGFMFQASEFADVSSRWGVSFTVWNAGAANRSERITLNVKESRAFSVRNVHDKTIYNSDGRSAANWVRSLLGTTKSVDAPQLSSGLKVKQTGHGKLAEGAVMFFGNNANSLTHSATLVYFVSSADTVNHGLSVLSANYRRVVALFSARKLVAETWINQKDEYLAPTAKTEASAAYNHWVDDCHVYAILHGSNNCTAMRDVQYKGKSWRIKNHWFWRTREASLAALDTRETSSLYRDCKAEPTVKSGRNHFTGEATAQPWEVTGDPYFAYVLPSLTLSADARKVLDLLDALWVKSLPLRESFASGRPELHLGAWDSGCYQTKHLWRELFPTEWAEITAAHKALAARLQDGVYDHGFLRR